MSAQPFVLTPDSYPAPLSVVGVNITVLASAETTQGYEVTFQQGDAGTGPPLHTHPWDECFFVLKGAVQFTFTDRTVLARPGTMFHLPAGTPHGFQIMEDGSSMLEVTGRGSQSTRMFTNIDREVSHGTPTAENIPKLIEILSRYGAAVVG